MLVLALAIGLAGCTSYYGNLRSTASRLGFEYELVAGSEFDHLVVRNYIDAVSRDLHVYIEGDGSPWVRGHLVATDPTPRNLLAIRLMAQDSAPSVYLGRPCYFGLARVPPCDPSLWTDARYSGRVAGSMQRALEYIVSEGGFRHLTLIGHSGGGVLAVLLAERLRGTRAVITVAANLDIERWARLRGYSPLAGSLNPATRPPLDPTVRQMHLAGSQDTIVPIAVTESYLRNRDQASLVVFENFDHTCCWEQIWPDVLRVLEDPGSGPIHAAE